MTLATAGAPRWRRLINANAEPVEYTPHGATTPVTLRAFLRSPTAEELAGAAMQSDIIAVIDASLFVEALPAKPRPTKFDRLKTSGIAGMSYTVETWYARPASGGTPVNYKLILRGGEQ